jgi:Na+/H+-dicarboxylate symporter
MNGCAAFIFITVIYLMQNAGVDISAGTMAVWIFIATLAAIGNAGVPMGCYFLAMSLLASMDIPVMLMGLILPIYAVIDMLETSLNVWSDSCVATMVNRDLETKEQLNRTDVTAGH